MLVDEWARNILLPLGLFHCDFNPVLQWGVRLRPFFVRPEMTFRCSCAKCRDLGVSLPPILKCGAVRFFVSKPKFAIRCPFKNGRAQWGFTDGLKLYVAAQERFKPSSKIGVGQRFTKRVVSQTQEKNLCLSLSGLVNFGEVFLEKDLFKLCLLSLTGSFTCSHFLPFENFSPVIHNVNGWWQKTMQLLGLRRKPQLSFFVGRFWLIADLMNGSLLCSGPL